MATRKTVAKSNRAAAAKKDAPSRPPRAKARVQLTESDPQEKPFTPKVLDRTAIAIPLLEDLLAEEKAIKAKLKKKRDVRPVIIDLHLEYPGGRDAARQRVIALAAEIVNDKKQAWKIKESEQGISKRRHSEQYLFGAFEGRVIQEMIRRDRPEENSAIAARSTKRAIYRIWPDFKVKALLNKSISTVKADAALNAFSTTGDNIVWAVMDSGIDALHPHFAKFDNLNLSVVPPLAHCDLTALDGNEEGALADKFGHGTHVAGIIAGTMSLADGELVAMTRFRDENGEIREQTDRPPHLSGMAPKCKLLSLKVLGDDGQGQASNLIAAIDEIQRINGNGRYIRVHGVNMSIGYDFEPEWFACGQSPLCVEVDRLVKSGVVVVVAAGNTGYGDAVTGSPSAPADLIDRLKRGCEMLS